MNVGVVSTRFRGTDGVSLETAKVADVIEEAGHDVAWFAGELGERFHPGTTHPLAHFKAPAVLRITEAAFGQGTWSPATPAAMDSITRELKEAVCRFVDEFDVDVLIAENVLCLPMNLPLGLAVGQLLAESGLPAVGHHHDFAWERARFRRTIVPHLLSSAFPPALDNLRHIVIQSTVQHELQRRRGLDSVILPNVMDFERGPARPGDGAAYRQAAGLDPEDLLLLQPTRVVPRKGIETTLQLAYELADEHVKVVVSHEEGDEGPQYGQFLRDEAERLGVDLRCWPTPTPPPTWSATPAATKASATPCWRRSSTAARCWSTATPSTRVTSPRRVCAASRSRTASSVARRSSRPPPGSRTRGATRKPSRPTTRWASSTSPMPPSASASSPCSPPPPAAERPRTCAPRGVSPGRHLASLHPGSRQAWPGATWPRRRLHHIRPHRRRDARQRGSRRMRFS